MYGIIADHVSLVGPVTLGRGSLPVMGVACVYVVAVGDVIGI